VTQSEVKILLDTAINGDLHPVERRDALKNLALTVEKNSGCADSDSSYDELLPQPLRDVRLAESEKSEIVRVLCKQIQIEPLGCGVLTELLWAIGKTDVGPSADALRCVLACTLERQLSGSELRQAILCLEDLTYMVQDRELIPLLPLLTHLKANVIATRHDESLNAINSYFAKLGKRGLPGV
jgi:hypothetical protein